MGVLGGGKGGVGWVEGWCEGWEVGYQGVWCGGWKGSVKAGGLKAALFFLGKVALLVSVPATPSG